MAEKEKLESLTTRIPVSLGTRLRMFGVRTRQSIQCIVTKAVEEYLAKERSKK